APRRVARPALPGLPAGMGGPAAVVSGDGRAGAAPGGLHPVHRPRRRGRPRDPPGHRRRHHLPAPADLPGCAAGRRRTGRDRPAQRAGQPVDLRRRHRPGVAVGARTARPVRRGVRSRGEVRGGAGGGARAPARAGGAAGRPRRYRPRPGTGGGRGDRPAARGPGPARRGPRAVASRRAGPAGGRGPVGAAPPGL
ncbi:MAG: hypothetical protein AVDCRST_MAG41-2960, partial [uncultured Corynebacteriales bacterium]